MKRGDFECCLSADDVEASWSGGLAVLFSPTHGFTVTPNDRIINDPSHLPYIHKVLHANEAYIASVVPNSSGSEAVVILFAGARYDGPYDLCQGDVLTADIVNTYFPGYADLRLKWRKAKTALVYGVSPLDSLAALERQVDLLTMLVLTLAQQQPSDEQPPWLPQLSEVFGQTSSVSEESVISAIAAMKDYKSHIRSLQKEYFKKRQA